MNNSSRKNNIPQLLKWVGNKHKYAHEIISYMPDTIETYIEPFLGSGAVLGTLSCINNNPLLPIPKFNKAVAGDALKYVIDIFNYVKHDPLTLINHYEKCIINYETDRQTNYERIKERFNINKDSLDFAVLTRTCYSGIVRFRKSDGYMSTPVGPHKPISPASFAERVYIWHELVKNVTFINADFKETFDFAKKGDLIYCDPPYTHSQSILYGAQEFNINNLWKAIYTAKQNGAKIMLSINGMKKSKKQDIGITPPEGLFEKEVLINCGTSMVNRLQKIGYSMENEEVHDKLLLTW